MKKYKKCLLIALLTVISIWIIPAIDTNSYAKSPEKAEKNSDQTVTAKNAESICIEADNGTNAVVAAQAAGIAVRLETGGAVSGYIKVHCESIPTVSAKVLISKDDRQYLYSLSTGAVNLPLQMGDGVYHIIVYKQDADSPFKRMTEFTINVVGQQDQIVYLNSIQMADYEGYSEVVHEINQSLVNARSDSEKVNSIYKYIISNFSYSGQKAESVRNSAGYLPDLRDFMDSGQGICYDYASLFATVLRSNGIPAKLVMGNRTDINKYHAWNEVLLSGRWVVIDTTCDSQLVQAGHAVEMIKDSALFLKIKEY